MGRNRWSVLKQRLGGTRHGCVDRSDPLITVRTRRRLPDTSGGSTYGELENTIALALVTGHVSHLDHTTHTGLRTQHNALVLTTAPSTVACRRVVGGGGRVW